MITNDEIFTPEVANDMFDYSTSYSGYKLAHLISESRNLEYLNIDCIKGVPFLYEYQIYSHSNNDDDINDTRNFKSVVGEIYKDEYYEFIKEFNEYMEYHEVYDS